MTPSLATAVLVLVLVSSSLVACGNGGSNANAATPSAGVGEADWVPPSASAPRIPNAAPSPAASADDGLLGEMMGMDLAKEREFVTRSKPGLAAKTLDLETLEHLREACIALADDACAADATAQLGERRR